MPLHFRSPDPPDLATRLLNNRYFAGSWAVFLLTVVAFVVWPIRDVVMVCWVYGTRAYFQGGVHVLPGKPLRFSNGALVPRGVDMITGAAAFFVPAVGLTLLLIFALRVYESQVARRGKPRRMKL